MFAVTMLVADDRLDLGRVKHLFDLHALGAGERDGFLERDQFRAGLNAGFNQRRAQIGQGAEAKDVRFNRGSEGARVGADLRIAQFRRGGFKAGFINVTNAGDFEAGIGVESRGVVHAAFAHSDDDDFVGLHGD
jgi:hypothetical protein